MTFITLERAGGMVGDGITARTMRTYLEKRQLRARKIGRQWYTTIEWVEDFKRWLRDSCSTDPMRRTEQPKAIGTSDTHTLSAGTKDGGSESEKLAWHLTEELARQNATQPRRVRKRRSASISSVTSHSGGKVVPLRPTK